MISWVLIPPGICNYWDVEASGIVSAKIDERKTGDTRRKIIAIVNSL